MKNEYLWLGSLPGELERFDCLARRRRNARSGPQLRIFHEQAFANPGGSQGSFCRNFVQELGKFEYRKMARNNVGIGVESGRKILSQRARNRFGKARFGGGINRDRCSQTFLE